MNDEEMLLFESLRGRHPLADVDVGSTEGTVGDAGDSRWQVMVASEME